MYRSFQFLPIFAEQTNYNLVFNNYSRREVLMTDEVRQGENKLGCLPYAIGGCSFIPLVGALFGIAAIVWGIVRFKEGGWKLVALGGGGILVTILLYGAFFYFGFVQKGGVYDDLRAKMAKQSVVSAAKSVEFYKTTHGHYPVSLEEIEKGASPQERLYLYDPTFKPSLTELSSAKPKFFYYQLEPDQKRYYLLSEGPDGKPFTADDITPEFSDEELKNMGLKIRR
jgi:hypothetical protein